MKLQGRVAIVTGGGNGIGRAAAIAMAAEGATVAIVDVDEAQARDAAQEIAGRGGRAVGLAGDVSRAADVTRFVGEAEAAFGPVTITFNNAGIQLHKSLVDTDEEGWDRLFAVNVKDMFLVSKAVIPSMERAGGGVILNAASVASFRPLMGGDTAYVASKGAILAMTRDMAFALMRRNIRVLALCPGPTRTGILARSLQLGVVTEETVRALQLTDHIAEPDEIGRMAAFLVSDDARYIVGSGVLIDGGMSIT